jgi:hypothetical protein
MATEFKNKIVKEVGTSAVMSIETDSLTQTTVIGLKISNLTEYMVYAGILLRDADNVMGYFMKDIMIPANSSLHAVASGEKLILAENNQLFIVADEAASLDAIISYIEIRD